MPAPLSSRCLVLTLTSALAVGCAAAQEAVDDEDLEQRITTTCGTLRERDKLVLCTELMAQAAQARGFSFARAAERAKKLEPVPLFELLRRSVRIVGHYYLCTECDEWHFSGASGFCVDADGAVATCAHVLAPDETMRQAFLVVADMLGNVWPVERVLASDAGSDVLVVKTAETGCVPLPLRSAVRVGERVYCLSHPDHQFGFFSEGIVARWYVQRDEPPEGAAPSVAAAMPKRRWLHVTCDFAKGSSGAPIVDCTGTVVGIAQSTTTVLFDEDAAVLDTQMVFKTAVPAQGLMDLMSRPPGK